MKNIIMQNIFTSGDSWRNDVVTCALEYTNFAWLPTDRNVFHGYDTDGILVNTPDSNYISSKYNCGWWLVNEINIGIPYNWGGCLTIIDFETGLAQGKFAGNVPDFRNNGISENCIGVDCSGLVTVCWQSQERLYTKSIPAIAAPLDSLNLLLPGDIILLTGSHVMIFIQFSDEQKTKAQIVDASRSTGKVLLRTVDLTELSRTGYVGFRKIL